MSPSTPIWLTPPLREECGHLFVFWHQWLNLDQNSGQGLFSIFWALVVCCTPALLGHMYGGWPTSSDACWASLLCRCCCGSPWSSGRSRHSSHILEPRPQETSCVHHTPWPHTKRTQGMSYLHLQDKACCSPNWWPSLKNKSANKKKSTWKIHWKSYNGIWIYNVLWISRGWCGIIPNHVICGLQN